MSACGAEAGLHFGDFASGESNGNGNDVFFVIINRIPVAQLGSRVL